MFETDAEIDALVDAVYAKAADLGRGDVLAHDVVREIVGCEPHTDRWPNVMRRVKNRIREERGIAILPEIGVGYRLLTHNETTGRLAAHRNKKARSQFRKLRREISALPDQELNDHQRRRKHFILDSIRKERGRLMEQEKLFAVVAKPSFAAPRRRFEERRPDDRPAPTAP